MIWRPIKPVSSQLTPRVAAIDYPKDYELDFEKNRITSNKIDGMPRFIQMFKTVLLSNNTPLMSYGLAELLPTAAKQSDYEVQCEKLAEAIVCHKFSDSTGDNPHGLGFTVESVCSVCKNEDGFLSFEITVTGIDGTVEISVPVSRLSAFQPQPQ